MSKSSRLIQIITLLQARRTAISAEQLATQLEVSERTIYRDIQHLRDAGMEIDGEAGVGYLLCKNSTLAPLRFNHQELQALMLGIRLVNAWGDDALVEAAEQALNKIKAVLPEHAVLEHNRLTTPFLVPPTQRLERLKYSQSLRQAIEQHRQLKIDYRDEQQRPSQRQIWPLGLVFWGAAWTLVAWCQLRDDYRMFRIDRIQELEVLETRFETHPNCSFKDYIQRYDPQVNTGFW